MDKDEHQTYHAMRGRDGDKQRPLWFGYIVWSARNKGNTELLSFGVSMSVCGAPTLRAMVNNRECRSMS